MSILVNVDNFTRSETHRMMRDLLTAAGGINQFSHAAGPALIEDQAVIRLNRDTLYSFAVVDIRDGATLHIPQTDGRYVSAMVVNEDHFVNAIFHDAGDYELTQSRFDTPYVVVAVRILADPADPADLATVAELQPRFTITADSAIPFEMPDYDTTTFNETRDALLALARNLTGFDRMFGSRTETDPVRHLIGAAAGWGGLPETEAQYIGVDPRLPAGQYELTVRDVPVDGFWSVSVYNSQGYFEPNSHNAYTINNITGVPNEDGSITVRFGGYPDGTPNVIPTPEGWNYLVRLYRPRAEALDGSWEFPTLAETV